jgi:hypothetical protein
MLLVEVVMKNAIAIGIEEIIAANKCVNPAKNLGKSAIMEIAEVWPNKACSARWLKIICLSQLRTTFLEKSL